MTLGLTVNKNKDQNSFDWKQQPLTCSPEPYSPYVQFNTSSCLHQRLHTSLACHLVELNSYHVKQGMTPVHYHKTKDSINKGFRKQSGLRSKLYKACTVHRCQMHFVVCFRYALRDLWTTHFSCFRFQYNIVYVASPSTPTHQQCVLI